MIDQAAIQIRGQASAQLADAVAQFLAAGGAIQEAPSGQCNPNPIAFIQPRITPAKARKSRAKSPEERQPRRPSMADLSRTERDAMLAEMSKTMTIPQVMAATALSRGVVSGVAHRKGFTFPLAPAIDEGEDAHYIQQVKDMRDLGLTRTHCCRRLNISLTKLGRLLIAGNINYPTTGPGRPR